MVLLKPLFFMFLSLHHFRSVTSNSICKISNQDDSRDLFARNSKEKTVISIARSPYHIYPNTHKRGTLFHMEEVGDLTFEIQAMNNFDFVHCPSRGVSCITSPEATRFRLTVINNTIVNFNSLDGLRLTLGKNSEESVTLEDPDGSTSQIFKVITLKY